MLEHETHYLTLLKMIDSRCTCEIVKTIAEICIKKSNEVKAHGNKDIAKKLGNAYIEYAECLLNLVNGKLCCPSQYEEDLLFNNV
jgi:hypothetical protein